MTPSQPVAERRVGTHQDEAPEAKAKKDEVEHAATPRLRAGGQTAAIKRKVSIGNSALRHKGEIKMCLWARSGQGKGWVA